MTDLDGLDVLPLEPGRSVTGHEPRTHPAALWTQQVLAGGHIRAIVRNVDAATSFDEIHRIAEKVADDLGVGAADVLFWGPDDPITDPTTEHAARAEGPLLVLGPADARMQP